MLAVVTPSVSVPEVWTKICLPNLVPSSTRFSCHEADSRKKTFVCPAAHRNSLRGLQPYTSRPDTLIALWTRQQYSRYFSCFYHIVWFKSEFPFSRVVPSELRGCVCVGVQWIQKWHRRVTDLLLRTACCAALRDGVAQEQSAAGDESRPMEVAAEIGTSRQFTHVVITVCMRTAGRLPRKTRSIYFTDHDVAR